MTPHPTRAPGLDVLRGLAIALVMLRHAWPSTFGGAGITGVVVFFALSGYLITGVLMTAIERHGRLRLRRFYLNRALRLYPALVTFLVIFCAIQLAFDPDGDRELVSRTFAYGALYLTDLGLPINATAGHLWTLAVEEQFYLVWPVLLLLAVRKQLLGVTMSVLVVGLWLLCAAVLWALHDDVQRAYVLPTSWALCLLLGAVARLYQQHLPRGRAATASAAVGLAVVAAASFLPDVKSNPLTYLMVGPAVALSAIAIISSARSWQSTPHLARPLSVLGLVSYAAYLWNYPLSTWIGGSESERGGWSGVVGIGATIAVAMASWISVEALGRAGRRVSDRRFASTPSPSGAADDPQAVSPPGRSPA